MGIFSQVKLLQQTLKIATEMKGLPNYLKSFSGIKYQAPKMFKNASEFIRNAISEPEIIGVRVATKGRKTTVDAALTRGGLFRKIFDGDKLVEKIQIEKSRLTRTFFAKNTEPFIDESTFITKDLKSGNFLSKGKSVTFKPLNITETTEYFQNGTLRITETLQNGRTNIKNLVLDKSGNYIGFTYSINSGLKV